MQSPRPTVVLDVDGVLLDFDASFAAVGSAVLGRPLVPLNRLYSLTRRYGLSGEEFNTVWAAMDTHEAGRHALPLMQDAAEAFLALQRSGYAVHLVTAVEPTFAERRLANLAQHGLVPDHIHCVGLGSVSKREVILGINPVAYADDRLHLLHEVPEIPHRIWVDNNDDQDGVTWAAPIVTAPTLAHWARTFVPDAWAPEPPAVSVASSRRLRM